MRLIDADELKKLILAERDKIPLTTPGAIYEFGVAKPNPHGQSMRGGIRKALRCMEQCPTVDAKPVVHGRWVGKQLDNFRKYQVTCSECGWIGIENYDSYNDPSSFNYCPNCGADMRECDAE
jgi:hypothetical protein